MGIAHTIAKERIFRGLRRRLGGKETTLGFLFSCPYCLSHWLAFVLVPLTGAYYVAPASDLGWFGDVVNWFLSSILVVVIAAFLRVAFYFIDESQGVLRRREVREDMALERLRRELEQEHRRDRPEEHPPH